MTRTSRNQILYEHLRTASASRETTHHYISKYTIEQRVDGIQTKINEECLVPGLVGRSPGLKIDQIRRYSSGSKKFYLHSLWR